jgi:hypothetical protein
MEFVLFFAGWAAGVRFLVVAGISSPLHSVQTDSGALPASYPMGTGDSSPGGNAAEA